jgi:hypothetical protein
VRLIAVAMAFVALAAWPAMAPAPLVPLEALISARCAGGTCSLPEDKFFDLADAHNDQLDEIAELRRELAAARSKCEAPKS